MGGRGARATLGQTVAALNSQKIIQDSMAAKRNSSPPSRGPNSRAPPRAAKGVSSIRSSSEFPSKPGPMRYRVSAGMPLRHKVWMTLDDPTFTNPDREGLLLHKLASHWATFSVLLIVSSTLTFLLESELNCIEKTQGAPPYGSELVTAANCEQWEWAWVGVEICAVSVFTAELLLRFASAPSVKRLLRQGFTWVDIMAVAPFFIEQIVQASGVPGDSQALVILQVLRVFRLARIFKLLRMGSFHSIQLVYHTAGSALQDSAQLLVALVMVMLICMVVFSAAVHEFEPGTNHTADSGDPASWFLSIPGTFWWGLVTLTGVGYGDSYPMKAAGRVVAVIAALVGVIIVAVPIEVIGRYFTSHYRLPKSLTPTPRISR